MNLDLKNEKETSASFNLDNFGLHRSTVKAVIQFFFLIIPLV